MAERRKGSNLGNLVRGDHRPDVAAAADGDPGTPAATAPAAGQRRARANTAAARPAGRPKQITLYTSLDEHRFVAQVRVDTGVPVNSLMRAAIELMREDADLLRRVVTRADTLEPTP